MPNITASAYLSTTSCETLGASYWNSSWTDTPKVGNPDGWVLFKNWLNFNASRSSPVYGKSATVQPPALTLLPCIKAFDALTDSGLVDISELANDINGKLDKVIDNKPVRYIVDAFDDGTSWWREWSDGWVEQGGNVAGGGAGLQTISLYKPYAGSYTLSVSCKSNDSSYWATFAAKTATSFQLGTKNYIGTYTFQDVDWIACGRGA